MERAKWTDDLIDQRMASMDEKADRQFEELRTLRAEMRLEFSAMRSEMHAGFSELRAEQHAFHRQVTLIIAAFGVGLLGLLGAGQL